MDNNYTENIIPSNFVDEKIMIAPSGIPVRPRIIISNTHNWEKKEAQWIDPSTGYEFHKGTLEFKDLNTNKVYTKETQNI